VTEIITSVTWELIYFTISAVEASVSWHGDGEILFAQDFIGIIHGRFIVHDFETILECRHVYAYGQVSPDQPAGQLWNPELGSAIYRSRPVICRVSFWVPNESACTVCATTLLQSHHSPAYGLFLFWRVGADIQNMANGEGIIQICMLRATGEFDICPIDS
jgi:hypothetical protein